MSQNPCPKCSADRPSLEDICPNCGWRPDEIHAEREPLIQVRPDRITYEEGGSQDKNSIRFSLRRLFGVVTLGCVALGAAIAFAPRSGNIPELTVSILGVILAVETALTVYAACDPWLGCPSTLHEERSATGSHPFRTNLVTRILGFLIGALFLVFGGLAAALIVDDNWSMDSGGASSKEWLMGLPFIVATMIGSFARGASLVGFLTLLCGTPLGRDFAKYFGLCGGSFLALLLWVPTHDLGVDYAADNYRLRSGYGNLASGIVGLLTLAVCWGIGWWFRGRGVSFGRRARRRAARLYLLGLLIGSGAALIPTLQWLLFGKPPTSLFFGAMIGSSLGAILGILTGSSERPFSPARNPFRSSSSHTEPENRNEPPPAEE